VRRIVIRHIVSWTLAAVCLSMMTSSTTAGLLLRGCAADEMHILKTIERRVITNAVSAKRLGDATLTTAHAQTASIPDQKLDALATAMRALTSQGLFAEEYDAILEAAQDDPHLRKKIIEHILALPE